MPRARPKPDYPLSMRLPAPDIALIDRAAGLHGRSRTEFVRDAAVRAAEDAIMERTLIRMSPAGFNAFVRAVSGPAIAVPELEQVLAREAPWERGKPAE